MKSFTLKQIDRLIDQDQFDDALAACDQLLNSSSDHDSSYGKAEIFRKRAHVYAVQGLYKHALVDREQAIQLDPNLLADYFQSAWYALSDAQFRLAADYYLQVIQLSKVQKEDWFFAASFFLLAYAEMQLSNYPLALDYLSQAEAIESDIGYILPNEFGVVTAPALRAQILKNQYMH